MYCCKKRISLIYILCVCLILFTACGIKPDVSETSDGTEANSSAVDSRPIPQENRYIVSGSDICPSSTGDGYYICTNTVHYFDAESGQTITLCAQTGCAHQDSTCQAWIGNVQNYTEYHGSLYAVIAEKNDSIQFIRKDLSGGEITVLDTWQDTEDLFYQATIAGIADNIAVVQLTAYMTYTEDGNITIDEQNTYWRYDLPDKGKQLLFPDAPAGNLGVMAISSEYIVARYTPEEQTVLDEEEFIAQYGENASYGRYLGRAGAQELRLYNSDTSVYTVIASTEQDNLIMTADPYYVYGKQVVYQCDDIIYLLNADTGETKELLTMENIINYWLMDEKVFLITQNMPYYIASDPGREVGVYYAGLEEAIPVKLNNGGNISSMEFSISQEGASFFTGGWNGGTYIIGKSDFYCDQYERAKQIG